MACIHAIADFSLAARRARLHTEFPREAEASTLHLFPTAEARERFIWEAESGWSPRSALADDFFGELISRPIAVAAKSGPHDDPPIAPQRLGTAGREHLLRRQIENPHWAERLPHLKAALARRSVVSRFMTLLDDTRRAYPDTPAHRTLSAFAGPRDLNDPILAEAAIAAEAYESGLAAWGLIDSVDAQVALLQKLEQLWRETTNPTKAEGSVDHLAFPWAARVAELLPDGIHTIVLHDANLRALEWRLIRALSPALDGLWILEPMAEEVTTWLRSTPMAPESNLQHPHWDAPFGPAHAREAQQLLQGKAAAWLATHTAAAVPSDDIANNGGYADHKPDRLVEHIHFTPAVDRREECRQAARALRKAYDDAPETERAKFQWSYIAFVAPDSLAYALDVLDACREFGIPLDLSTLWPVNRTRAWRLLHGFLRWGERGRIELEEAHALLNPGPARRRYTLNTANVRAFLDHCLAAARPYASPTAPANANIPGPDGTDTQAPDTLHSVGLLARLGQMSSSLLANPSIASPGEAAAGAFDRQRKADGSKGNAEDPLKVTLLGWDAAPATPTEVESPEEAPRRVLPDGSDGIVHEFRFGRLRAALAKAHIQTLDGAGRWIGRLARSLVSESATTVPHVAESGNHPPSSISPILSGTGTEASNRRADYIARIFADAYVVHHLGKWLSERMKGSVRIGAYVEAIRGLLHGLFAVPLALTNPNDWQEEGVAVHRILECMDRLLAADPTPEIPPRAMEHRLNLTTEVGMTGIRLPADLGGVRLLDIPQAHGVEFQCVFGLGLSADALPRPAGESPFGPPQLEERLWVLPDNAAARHQLMKMVANTIECRLPHLPGLPRVSLGWPATIEGQEVAPALPLRDLWHALGRSEDDWKHLNASLKGGTTPSPTAPQDRPRSAREALRRAVPTLLSTPNPGSAGSDVLGVNPAPQWLAQGLTASSTTNSGRRPRWATHPLALLGWRKNVISMERSRRDANTFDGFTGNLSVAKNLEHLTKRLQNEPLSSQPLDDYAHCPFRWFARRGLKLSPKVETDADRIQDQREGSLLHHVLYRHYEAWVATGSTDRPPTDAPGAFLHLLQKLSEAVADHRYWPLDKEGAYFMAMLREWVGAFARPVAEGQAIPQVDAAFPLGSHTLSLFVALEATRLAKWTPERLEWSFGVSSSASPHPSAGGENEAFTLSLPHGAETLRVTGRIDRVDVLKDHGGLLVIDYKRSPPKDAVRKIEEGRSFQMPLYLLVLDSRVATTSSKGHVLGAGYYVVRRGQVEIVSPWGDRQTLSQQGVGSRLRNNEAVKTGEQLKAALDLSRKRIADIGNLICEGRIPLSRLSSKDAGCDYCEVRFACRRNEPIDRQRGKAKSAQYYDPGDIREWLEEHAPSPDANTNGKESRSTNNLAMAEGVPLTAAKGKSRKATKG